VYVNIDNSSPKITLRGPVTLFKTNLTNLTKWSKATLLIAINEQISLLQFDPVIELVKENRDNDHVG
jgi:hypothetical protein